MITAFQNAVSYLCFAVLAALACVCVFVGFRQVGKWLRANLCPVSLVVFAAAAVIATCEAQKRGGEGGSGASAQPIVQSIPGAVTNADWLAHGAYEDWFYICPSNWWARMPGGGWIDRLRIFSFGGFQAKDPSGGAWTNYPPPFAQKISLAPEANWPLLEDHDSFFWHATTPSNTLVMTWLGGLYARSHTNLVDFQAELFNDGSFAYRYADRTEHFAASLPFDRDGDGLENSVDPEPDVAGPDAHGTNAEWYNTVCSNVFLLAAWREGVNSNAYYFVDVVAERGPAPIRFTGDRPSRLGDPVVVALAGETNRVPLLIGVDYAVTSDTPFSVSFPVDYIYPEVETNEPCRAHVRWPLVFMVSEMPSAYAVETVPPGLNGTFEWGGAGGGTGTPPMRSASCGYTANGGNVSFNCIDCGCGGCSISGCYRYEAATFDLPILWCGCTGDGEPDDEPIPTPHAGPVGEPSVDVSFDKSAVIFENAYENTPGSWVEKNSSSVTLTVTAYGGVNGATLSMAETGLSRLEHAGGNSFPRHPVSVPPGCDVTYDIVYEGYEASGGANDIRVNASVTDGMTGASRTDSAAITSIRVELEPEKVAPGNNCPNRHVYGVREEVNCKQTPNAPVITWDIDSDLGIAVTVVGARISNTLPPRLVCPLNAQYTFTFKAKCGLAVYPFDIQVLNPSGIRCADCVWNERTKFDHKIGYAGWVGMYLTLYVEPLSVSFGNIDVSEVPSTGGNHTEYFDYLDMQYRTHTVATGAGVWHHVLDNNYFAIDHVQCLNRPQTWIDGSQMTWQVPHGWHERAEADMWPIGMTPLSDNVFATDITQMTTLNANGLVNMSKHGHAVSRSTNNCVRVDGAIVHEGE